MTRAVDIFGLRIRHEVHPDQRCRALQIAPTAATRRLLDRHRLLLRQRPDGVDVVGLTGADGQSALIALPRNAVFGFTLSAPDPGFAACTDLRDLAGMADPVYRNDNTGAAGGLALSVSDRISWASETLVAPVAAARLGFTLASKPLPLDGNAVKRPRAADFRLLPPAGATKVSAYDAVTRTVTLAAVSAGQQIALRYRTPAPARAGTLAAVELRYDKRMAAPGQAAPMFELRFKARSARWAYYLLTDQDGDFAIVDAAPQGTALGFSAANRTVLDVGAEATDPVARLLARHYAGLRRLRFLSDQPVPCSTATRRGIELRRADQRVLCALPNPPPENLSRILDKPDAPLQGQDMFHQVIRCLHAS
jgi:hypothetical protein